MPVLQKYYMIVMVMFNTGFYKVKYYTVAFQRGTRGNEETEKTEGRTNNKTTMTTTCLFVIKIESLCVCLKPSRLQIVQTLRYENPGQSCGVHVGLYQHWSTPFPAMP